MLRRVAPVLLIAATGVLLVSYVVHTLSLVSELRAYSRRSSELHARIYEAQSRPYFSPDSNLQMWHDLSRRIMEMKVPTVIMDTNGVPQSCINLPFCDPVDMKRASAAAERFARENSPVPLANGQRLYFGYPGSVQSLSIIPFVQAAALVLVLVTGFVLMRERVRSQRERLWAGMARESAHQIATPLSSLSGWLQLLADTEGGEMTARAVGHMHADLDRLERVAHRFERIGRPPRRENVDVTALTAGVADYFRARVPTLAHSVRIEVTGPDSPAGIQGDPVLLEWAIEAVVKNAIDALAGREGLVEIIVGNVPEGGVRIRIADSGPGVNRDLRSLIFQPGFTTKEHGWGVGLALTRRIVEENHGGELILVPSESGAIFDIVLP